MTLIFSSSFLSFFQKIEDFLVVVETEKTVFCGALEKTLNSTSVNTKNQKKYCGLFYSGKKTEKTVKEKNGRNFRLCSRFQFSKQNSDTNREKKREERREERREREKKTERRRGTSAWVGDEGGGDKNNAKRTNEGKHPSLPLFSFCFCRRRC